MDLIRLIASINATDIFFLTVAGWLVGLAWLLSRKAEENALHAREDQEAPPGVRVAGVTVRPVRGQSLKAVATVRFEDGCELNNVKVLRRGTEFLVKVLWDGAAEECVKAGRLGRAAASAVREKVLDEYIRLLASGPGGA